MQSAWGLPCVGLKHSSNPSLLCFSFLIICRYLLRGVAPPTLAALCRPLVDNFPFIEDYYEDPEGTEIIMKTLKELKIIWKTPQ